MSADNGVYIGVFPKTDSSDKEYRVIEAGAIENCDYHFADDEKDNHRLQDRVRVCYYGKSKSFSSEKEAYAEAQRIYEEIISTFGICEYGISQIDYERPLPDISIEQARQELDVWWKRFEAVRQKENEERQHNTKVYYVLMPVRCVEYKDEVTFGGTEVSKLREYKRYGTFTSQQEADQALADKLIIHGPMGSDFIG